MRSKRGTPDTCPWRDAHMRRPYGIAITTTAHGHMALTLAELSLSSPPTHWVPQGVRARCPTGRASRTPSGLEGPRPVYRPYMHRPQAERIVYVYAPVDTEQTSPCPCGLIASYRGMRACSCCMYRPVCVCEYVVRAFRVVPCRSWHVTALTTQTRTRSILSLRCGDGDRGLSVYLFMVHKLCPFSGAWTTLGCLREDRYGKRRN
jgi:hypothetical protein